MPHAGPAPPAQGMVVASILKMMQERLRPLHAQRSELCRQLEELQLGDGRGPGDGGGGGGGRVAAWLAAPTVQELLGERPSEYLDQLHLFADISANFQTERCACKPGALQATAARAR